jgi:hypothetical protein
MNPLATLSIRQHSGADLEYEIDWAPWLNGDTINTYTLEASEEILVPTHSKTTTSIFFWLTSTEAGKMGKIKLSIVTAGVGLDRPRKEYVEIAVKID